MREHQGEGELGPPESIVAAVNLVDNKVCNAILVLLRVWGRQVCVAELTHELGWVQSNVSAALAKLKAAEWVASRSDGCKHYFWVTDRCPVQVDGERVLIEIKMADGDFRMVRAYRPRRSDSSKAGQGGM
jgi:hypothetical protein